MHDTDDTHKIDLFLGGYRREDYSLFLILFDIISFLIF